MKNYINNYAYAEEIMDAESSSRFALNFNANDWDVRIPTSYEEVIEQVVLAQVASDGGKEIPRFSFNAVNGIRRRTTAYPAKAVNMPALKLILI